MNFFLSTKNLDSSLYEPIKHKNSLGVVRWQPSCGGERLVYPDGMSISYWYTDSQINFMNDGYYQPRVYRYRKARRIGRKHAIRAARRTNTFKPVPSDEVNITKLNRK